ncbi:GtrA family protein [Haematospirillum jordaniae]|uniref:GtrA/DPMS transmembrane domain-containing protein n=2 Tax=Haematospirillum jordaniae TaxID=1549855 RepID=A0A143DFK6_9PROT|nr:GtrA family protein [Haematospirillum jordaniae]AMW35436.1 hypothetical protein AY555_09890 [Haematospirillum jordaniae]NKD45580.1 GtrA family protein [Haematospirillum jordaniae]NKD56124.1 GtrA family protein [Haematospirillum jordaniae]NKD58182.1 GtrA family protein [Haematospirillum jordaniae]NKD66647.1 GtrA family protein [Haematospirillum jordaniae]
MLFAVAGGFGTVVHYCVLVGLVELLSFDPVSGSVAGFLCGALTNYGAGRVIVFRSTRPHVETLPRFFMVAGTGFLWNGVLMTVLSGFLLWPYLVAQVAVTGFLLVWHYVLNALWTFRCS